MRGLLFAIVFCGFSLLLAEGITSLLVTLEFIYPDNHDQVHDVIMIFMLVCYAVFAPSFTKDSSSSKSNKFNGDDQ